MIGWLPTQALALILAVFVYATHATQAIAFEWKPGLRQLDNDAALSSSNTSSSARSAVWENSNS